MELPRVSPADSDKVSIGTNFDLQCWYIHAKRVLGAIGGVRLSNRIASLKDASSIPDERLRQATIDAVLEHEIVDWLRSNQIKTLGQHVVLQTLAAGIQFTTCQDFYGKGAWGRRRTISSEGDHESSAEIYANLERYGVSEKFRVLYNPRDLLSHSAHDRLSGHTRLFVAGCIERIKAKEIIARPYIIADIREHLSSGADTLILTWTNYNEIHASMIDNFAQVKDLPTQDQLNWKSCTPFPKLR